MSQEGPIIALIIIASPRQTTKFLYLRSTTSACHRNQNTTGVVDELQYNSVLLVKVFHSIGLSAVAAAATRGPLLTISTIAILSLTSHRVKSPNHVLGLFASLMIHAGST